MHAKSVTVLYSFIAHRKPLICSQCIYLSLTQMVYFSMALTAFTMESSDQFEVTHPPSNKYLLDIFIVQHTLLGDVGTQIQIQHELSL